MSIITEEIENVTIRREVFAPTIRIVANPEDTAAGVILFDLHQLEYQDDELRHIVPLENTGETVGEFAQRTFTVGEKEITGMEVVLLIKQYVATLHAEHEAAIE